MWIVLIIFPLIFGALFIMGRVQYRAKIRDLGQNIRVGVNRHEIPKISEFLVRAFKDDPEESALYSQVGNPDDLSSLGKTSTAWCVFYLGQIYNYVDSGMIKGVGMTLTLDTMTIPLIELIYSGFYRILFSMTPWVLYYYISKKRRIQQAKEEVISNRKWTKFTYIWILGVDPDHQGQGIGGSILRAILAQNTNVPLILETSKKENVEIYKKFGFQVEKEVDFGDFNIWIMIRSLTDN